MYDQATEEAALERLQLIKRGNKDVDHSVSGLNEEVFLAQLHRRSLLLNDEFQDAVRAVVMHHSSVEIDRSTSAEDLFDGQPRSLSSSKNEAPLVDSNIPLLWKRLFHSSSRLFGSSISAAVACEESGNPLHPVKHHLGVGADSHGKGYWKGVSNTSLLSNSDIFAERCPSVDTESARGMKITCKFRDGIAAVEVLPAPIKTLARMREKVLEYSAETTTSTAGGKQGNGWPQTARIVDPVRSSIVCDGPAQILEVFQWFSEGCEGFPSNSICRVKNRFSYAKGELLGGYACTQRRSL